MTAYSEELKKVRAIAKMARKAMEHLAKWEETHADFVEDWNDRETLGGYCARASAMLSMALERAGIKHTIIASHGHVFIKWRKNIVDITATQFSKKVGKTVICTRESLNKKVDVHKRSYWNEKYRFQNRIDLWTHQQTYEWPDSQSSQHYDDEFLEKLKEYKEYQYGIQK